MRSFLNPETVAVVGATERPGSVGRGLMNNLLAAGNRAVYPINPNEPEVLGHRSYPTLNDLPQKPDLVLIAVPQKLVESVIDDCVQCRVGGVIIITAGFGETGPEGQELEDRIKAKLQAADIGLIGPNCLGLLCPPNQLNASFAPGSPSAGSIAFISQSGALVDSVIDGTQQENYGFSLMISPGNAAGLNLADFLSWTDQDPNTEVVCFYIEGMANGREFFDSLKNSDKPVVVLKAGRSERSRRAISSHTGSLAGQAAVFSAALKQAGVIEVSSVQAMFDVTKALAWQPRFESGVAIVTNGGGAGVLATDYLGDLDLPELKPETLEAMADKMHPGYSAANPLDIVGDALSERYQAALAAVLEQDDIGAALVIQTLQIMTEPLDNAKIIIEAQKNSGKAIVTCFMGGGPQTLEAVQLLEENHIPNYPDPLRAAQAVKALNHKV